MDGKVLYIYESMFKKKSVVICLILLFFRLWYPPWGPWWLLQRHCGNLQERIHVALKALSSVDHFGQICSFSQACMDLDLSLGTELSSSDGWPPYFIASCCNHFPAFKNRCLIIN